MYTTDCLRMQPAARAAASTLHRRTSIVKSSFRTWPAELSMRCSTMQRNLKHHHRLSYPFSIPPCRNLNSRPSQFRYTGTASLHSHYLTEAPNPVLEPGHPRKIVTVDLQSAHWPIATGAALGVDGPFLFFFYFSPSLPWLLGITRWHLVLFSFIY